MPTPGMQQGPYAAVMRLQTALSWCTCLLLALAAAQVEAQASIHRCLGADGIPVFTDQPCAALDATPVARPTPLPAPDADTAAAASALPTTPATLCASNLAELKRAVIDAFASGNVNRLAGLMLWRGYGRKAAVADISALKRAMREPLLDFDPQPPSSSSFAPTPSITSPSAPAPPREDLLVLHTAGNDGSGQPHTLRFQIVRRSGCLWLRSAD